MSADDLKELSLEDQTHLRQDREGRLYWRGRRIKTAGWTASETAAVVSAVIAAFAALVVVLAQYDAIIRNIETMLPFGK